METKDMIIFVDSTQTGIFGIYRGAPSINYEKTMTRNILKNWQRGEVIRGHTSLAFPVIPEVNGNLVNLNGTPYYVLLYFWILREIVGRFRVSCPTPKSDRISHI